MILFGLRDIPVVRNSIKGMAGEPSKAELLELARQRIQDGRYTAVLSVKEQIAMLKSSKAAAADEDGLEEIPTTSIFDLTRVILDSSCRVIDVGSNKCWNITFEGLDRLANPLKVMAMLSRDDNSILVITSFLPSIRSTP
jgi:hypothetical protein